MGNDRKTFLRDAVDSRYKGVSVGEYLHEKGIRADGQGNEVRESRGSTARTALGNAGSRGEKGKQNQRGNRTGKGFQGKVLSGFV